MNAANVISKSYCNIVNKSQGAFGIWSDSNKPLVPNYTTDPAAAMDVLKKIRDEGVVVAIHGNILSQIGGKRLEVEAETLELAICLFAKKLFSK